MWVQICKCIFWCVSFRSNVIMTHTLTGFMELMDHGIVSWENLSSVFIKKVPHMPLLYILPHPSHILFYFSNPLPLLSDCQLRQRQADRCLNTAGVLGHPGEHGIEQPQPLPAGQAGSDNGEAHCSPPGVSDRKLWNDGSHSFLDTFAPFQSFINVKFETISNWWKGKTLTQ